MHLPLQVMNYRVGGALAYYCPSRMFANRLVQLAVLGVSIALQGPLLLSCGTFAMTGLLRPPKELYMMDPMPPMSYLTCSSGVWQSGRPSP